MVVAVGGVLPDAGVDVAVAAAGLGPARRDLDGCADGGELGDLVTDQRPTVDGEQIGELHLVGLGDGRRKVTGDDHVGALFGMHLTGFPNPAARVVGGNVVGVWVTVT